MPVIDMRVSCPNCATEYDVPDAVLGGRGRKLRCHRCGTKWRTAAPEGQEVAEDASASDETLIIKPGSMVLPVADWASLPKLDIMSLETPRSFGQPADAQAAAELRGAIGQETPAATDETGLPAFLTAARGDDTVLSPVTTPPPPDSFAELVYAARNKTVQLEPEPPPRPPAVKTSNTPLIVMLILLFVIAMLLVEHRLVIHLLPASAGFFHALGLK